MSEHRLWERLRGAIGNSGHFTRLEFNPEDGIPDVDYCVRGEEGKIELKYTAAAPKRASTAVFHDGGLRDSQIAWIYTRVRHGGRVFVLSQIGERLFLVDGKYCRVFNTWTAHEIDKNSVWSNEGRNISKAEWAALVNELKMRKRVA